MVEKREFVVLKGSADGVNMYLNSTAPMADIIECIKDKIKRSNGFFKGKCDVFVSGRELSKSDELRITSVMHTVFPEANIIFKKEPSIPEYEEVVPRNHTNMGARFMEELVKAAEYSKEMLRSDKADSIQPQRIDVKMYTGNIPAGKKIKTRGDLLVVGNVECGALVSSDGSIYIMGALKGTAVAGGTDNENCRIYAADFSPERVTIAGVTLEFDKIAQENVPKMAYLMKRTLAIENFL